MCALLASERSELFHAMNVPCMTSHSANEILGTIFASSLDGYRDQKQNI